MRNKWCKKEVKKPDENRKNEREMVFLKGLEKGKNVLKRVIS